MRLSPLLASTALLAALGLSGGLGMTPATAPDGGATPAPDAGATGPPTRSDLPAPGASSPTATTTVVAAGSSPRDRDGPPTSRWTSPVATTRLVRGFEAPAQDWLPGHRGVDLRAAPGTPVLAPADGTVAFVGVVAGRPVLSIDHADPQVVGGGLRTTYEPVLARVGRGERVRRGEVVATVANGTHCPGGCLHWGARRVSVYVDPMTLLRPAIRLWPPVRG